MAVAAAATARVAAEPAVAAPAPALCGWVSVHAAFSGGASNGSLVVRLARRWAQVQGQDFPAGAITPDVITAAAPPNGFGFPRQP
jgi:hypothetical protein